MNCGFSKDTSYHSASWALPGWIHGPICTTLANCPSLLKGKQGPTLALTHQQKCLSPLQVQSYRERSLHCGHCPCAVTRDHLAWNCQLMFGINSATWAAEWWAMNKNQRHGSSWAGPCAGLVEVGSVENLLLQYTLPNCFMFALCCPLGRNFLCVWMSNTAFTLLVKALLCSDDNT